MFQFKSVYKDEEEPELLDADVLIQHVTNEGIHIILCVALYRSRQMILGSTRGKIDTHYTKFDYLGSKVPYLFIGEGCTIDNTSRFPPIVNFTEAHAFADPEMKCVNSKYWWNT